LGAVEPIDAADRGHQPGRRGQVDAGEGQQTPDLFVLQRALGDVAVEHGEILRKPVQFTDMARNCGAFILRNRLARQPVATALVEEVGMGALRDQMRMQNSCTSFLIRVRCRTT
jgi:hypothetical protein